MGVGASVSGCRSFPKQVRADYKVIAKALTRKGNALAKLDRYEDAIAAYQKALTEHRRPSDLHALLRTMHR